MFISIYFCHTVSCPFQYAYLCNEFPTKEIVRCHVFPFSEYDIPSASDSSEINTSDLNASAADESVPGLAMGASAASSTSLPVPTAEGNDSTSLRFKVNV